MATTTGCLTFSSSSSLFPNDKTKITAPTLPKRFVSFSSSLLNFRYPKLSSLSLRLSLSNPARPCTVLAVVDEEAVVVGDEINGEDVAEEKENIKDDVVLAEETKKKAKPCELYVCNLPRSWDISELLETFKPFGTVISVEVSRNSETGISRGSGYVTMGSINSAKNAIAALDGSDVDGREVRVKFSVDMISKSDRRNPEALNSSPKKTFIYESPHKLYLGNLAWATKPEELRNHFSQFGTVVSARVLYDRKGVKNRVFAFISFSTAAECDAALSLNGTVKSHTIAFLTNLLNYIWFVLLLSLNCFFFLLQDFSGRALVVRKGTERSEP
ncbi:hypothetical protein Dsin_025829 [Dipteronia sinensis]|uniref:RRM domain-containing protein n=1 Tax=Dipteronia sinensis TaxID=43782 RepID=A0AAD9ZXP6_9ROSI|nr:hypothetical protein Dsin_025829 [Dipteronia sinensis]